MCGVALVSPIVIVMRSAGDYAMVKREAEAALRAGLAVNVGTERQDVKALVVRVLPVRGGGYLAITPDPRTTGLHQHLNDSLRIPLARARDSLEGGMPPEHMRGRA